MKQALLSIFTLLLSISMQAQFNYSFSHYTQAYMPLTSGISVNDTTRWDEETYKIPLGFTSVIDGKTMDSLTFNGLYAASDSIGIVNLFMLLGADLVDRGFIDDTASMSPIRYELTGTAPNRILKAEVFNAGFYDEYYLYATLTDSINMQVWVYETSNVIELHFGDHRLEYFDDYFTYDSTAVPVGFIKNIDAGGSFFDIFYYLSGDPANPYIDSTDDVFAVPESGLDSIPSSGTVYRFTPVPLNVTNVNKELFSVKVYPTLCRGEINVEQSEKGTVSYNIISVSGAAINKNGILGTGRNKIELEDLPPGAYVIQVRSDHGSRPVRFIKL